MADKFRPEYDMKSLLKGGVRGKYAQKYREWPNFVLLDPPDGGTHVEMKPGDKTVLPSAAVVVQAGWYPRRAAFQEALSPIENGFAMTAQPVSARIYSEAFIGPQNDLGPFRKTAFSFA